MVFMGNICQKEIYMGKFKDKRLDKRASRLSALLVAGRSSSIHAITSNESEQKAAYRFLKNEKTREQILISAIKERSGYLCSGKDVLVLQDTTDFNFANHRERLQPNTGIGVAGGSDKWLGFFLHSSLVLDQADETVLGFSDIQLWHRDNVRIDREQRGYKKLPIEEKESFKWIKACNESKKHLSAAASITFVEDREGDIYEQFATVPDERTHLIIRSRDNRNLSDGSKLYDTLSQQSVAGNYKIALVTDVRKGVEKRTAVVEVRFCKVRIAKSVIEKKKSLAPDVELYAIEVRETDDSVDSPIRWRILTTHSVNSFEDAIRIINHYKRRWYIEQLFRLLKKKGFDIQSSELESGWAIRKLMVMILNAALRVMQLLLAYDNEQSQPIEQVFDSGEIKCLENLNKTLQGDTEKSKNSHDPKRLSWATWIIARLGGWKNYNSKRPPGPIILKRGLDKFSSIYEGWKLALSS
jgi:hypothetical protein